MPGCKIGAANAVRDTVGPGTARGGCRPAFIQATHCDQGETADDPWPSTRRRDDAQPAARRDVAGVVRAGRCDHRGGCQAGDQRLRDLPRTAGARRQYADTASGRAATRLHRSPAQGISQPEPRRPCRARVHVGGGRHTQRRHRDGLGRVFCRSVAGTRNRSCRQGGRSHGWPASTASTCSSSCRRSAISCASRRSCMG